ncbi:mitochondrial inner membrane protein OXA1-like [Wolffia australiana]
MAASSRRTLACGLHRIVSQINSPFTPHIAASSIPNFNEDPRPKIPSFDRSSNPFALRSLASFNGDHRVLGLPFFPGFHLNSGRFYSSSSAGSGDVEYMKDIATVLTDKSVDVSADAVAQISPLASEVAIAAADSAIPVAALQHLIDAVHSFSGLNWWAAIALTTVLIRTATVPLLINGMKASTKLSLMRPHLEEIKERMQNSTDPRDIQESQKRMKELFKQHGVTPFTPLKGLFIQGPVFISFYLAITNMVEKVPSFKAGGALWFTDLTTADPLYMLPVLTSLSFLATVELNMQEGMEGNPMAGTMKNFSRILAFMTIPFTATFPKAIFCYWITSNLFSLTYGMLLKRPAVRTFLSLPEIPSSLRAASSTPSFPFFGGAKQVTATESDSSASSPQEKKTASSVINHRIRQLERKVKSRSKSKKR